MCKISMVKYYDVNLCIYILVYNIITIIIIIIINIIYIYINLKFQGLKYAKSCSMKPHVKRVPLEDP